MSLFKPPPVRWFLLVVAFLAMISMIRIMFGDVLWTVPVSFSSGSMFVQKTKDQPMHVSFSPSKLEQHTRGQNLHHNSSCGHTPGHTTPPGSLGGLLASAFSAEQYLKHINSLSEASTADDAPKNHLSRGIVCVCDDVTLCMYACFHK